MTEKKRQEITEVFKYLRGSTEKPKKDIPDVSFDSYVSHLLNTVKDIPLHYQLRLAELKKNNNFPELVSYLSSVLGSLIVSFENNEYTVKGLKYLSKYSKRNFLYDFVESKQSVLDYLHSQNVTNPYLLKVDLDLDGERHHDLCLLSRQHGNRFICIFGKKDLDFELAIGLLSQLKI